jgi:hypothetical protein
MGSNGTPRVCSELARTQVRHRQVRNVPSLGEHGWLQAGRRLRDGATCVQPGHLAMFWYQDLGS